MNVARYACIALSCYFLAGGMGFSAYASETSANCRISTDPNAPLKEVAAALNAEPDCIKKYNRELEADNRELDAQIARLQQQKATIEKHERLVDVCVIVFTELMNNYKATHTPEQTQSRFLQEFPKFKVFQDNVGTTCPFDAAHPITMLKRPKTSGMM